MGEMTSFVGGRVCANTNYPRANMCAFMCGKTCWKKRKRKGEKTSCVESRTFATLIFRRLVQ